MWADGHMTTLSVAFRYSFAPAPKIQDKIQRSYSWRISNAFTQKKIATDVYAAAAAAAVEA
jgi:hypothetical protein